MKIECSCGGDMNDWHSHASDCIIINPKGKDYGKEEKKTKTREHYT